MTSKNKLSKKACREMNNSRRVFWTISPVTRVVPNKKAYNRRRDAKTKEADN